MLFGPQQLFRLLVTGLLVCVSFGFFFWLFILFGRVNIVSKAVALKYKCISLE